MADSTTRKVMLDPAVLERAVCEVFCKAVQEGAHIALIGGYALQKLGSSRLTGDIDFVVDGNMETMPDLGKLSFGGVKSVTSEGVPVDLVVRDDDYALLYDDALTDARRCAQQGALPVVRAEYLAAMKMAANRPRDMADLEFLIAEDIIVSLPEARRLIKQHLGAYAAQEFDQIVVVAKWRKGRESRWE
jgi:hypothetical protein